MITTVSADLFTYPNAGQGTATVECSIANAGDAVRNADAGEGGTVGKRRTTNGGNWEPLRYRGYDNFGICTTTDRYAITVPVTVFRV